MPSSNPDSEDLRRVIFTPMLSVFSAIFDRAQNAERPFRHARRALLDDRNDRGYRCVQPHRVPGEENVALHVGIARRRADRSERRRMHVIRDPSRERNIGEQIVRPAMLSRYADAESLSQREPRDSDETASAEPTTTIASTRARSRQMCLLLGFVTKLSAAVNFSSDELSPLTHAPKSVDLRMIQCGLELVTLVGSTASSFMNEIHIFCFRCV
jgi:hypothetical protein